MSRAQRDRELMDILRERGNTSVQDLSKLLYASEATIRRILSDLESKGLIRRTHGGAELFENFTHVASFRSRIRLNASAKREIAQKAAALVFDGSIVFLDQSSTAYYLAEELMKKSGLIVVTNNIEIAVLLSQTSFEVFVSGGHLCGETRTCLVGDDSHRIFHEINADFAFFSARSLSEDGMISDCNRDEIFVRNAMLKNTKCSVFLCDSSKYGSTSGFRQCSLSDLDVLISEGCHSGQFAQTHQHLQLL